MRDSKEIQINKNGRQIVVKWDKKRKEYRAFEMRHGSLVDMMLGSLNADNLAAYIQNKY